VANAAEGAPGLDRFRLDTRATRARSLSAATAFGTGLNTHPEFSAKSVGALGSIPALNLFGGGPLRRASWRAYSPSGHPAH